MTVEWIEEGRICISDKQRRKHVFWETAALVVVAPFSAYLAFQPSLAPWARVLAAAVAGTTVVVDGSLLAQYRKKGKHT